MPGGPFCAGVCPHGALQDLVLLKPVKVPPWLEQALSVLPYIYLGAGVLFAATGSAFIICQYDPFVPIFRMSGRSLMVLSGAALLLLGVFVGRPYCRFLCPYGALLKLGAIVAKWRVRVTPDYCTQCRLCEASCPFGAMREPRIQPGRRASFSHRTAGAWRGCWRFCRCSWPAAAGWDPNSARRRRGSIRRSAWPTSSCARREPPPKFGALTPDDLALERARQTPKEILTEAAAIRRKFATGGWIFGAWVGLVIGVKLISLSVRRRRTDYEPDRGDCFACARCFEYCPNELVRRGLMPAAAPASGGVGSPGAPVCRSGGLQPYEPASRTEKRVTARSLTYLPPERDFAGFGTLQHRRYSAGAHIKTADTRWPQRMRTRHSNRSPSVTWLQAAPSVLRVHRVSAVISPSCNPMIAPKVFS